MTRESPIYWLDLFGNRAFLTHATDLTDDVPSENRAFLTRESDFEFHFFRAHFQYEDQAILTHKPGFALQFLFENQAILTRKNPISSFIKVHTRLHFENQAILSL